MAYPQVVVIGAATIDTKGRVLSPLAPGTSTPGSDPGQRWWRRPQHRREPGPSGGEHRPAFGRRRRCQPAVESCSARRKAGSTSSTSWSGPISRPARTWLSWTKTGAIRLGRRPGDRPGRSPAVRLCPTRSDCNAEMVIFDANLSARHDRDDRWTSPKRTRSSSRPNRFQLAWRRA